MATFDPHQYSHEDLEWTVRIPTPEDSHDIRLFFKQHYAETDYLRYEPDEYTATDEDVARFLTQCADSPVMLYLIAVSGGEIIGALVFTGHDLNRHRHHGDFGMGVSKQHWGKGVGRSLLDTLFQWAGANGIFRIALTVMERNERAVEFYERTGFEVEGRLRKDYRRTDGTYGDALIMARLTD